jgi:hypothetical protein
MTFQLQSQTPTVATKNSGMMLQRKCSCGNHTASGGECAECSKKKMQKKLRIGAVNDPLEYEADRVADQVLRMPLDAKTKKAPIKLQRLSHTGSDHEGGVPESVHQTLSGSGRPLDASLQQDMSNRFGHDFSGVRVHQGGGAEQSVRDVNAKAYTVGKNIVFGTGEYAPSSPSGRHLIAHELAHVVQQQFADTQNNVHGSLQRQNAGTTEVDIELQSPEEVEKLRKNGITLPGSVALSSPYATILPGYAQYGDTCGAASLVTALMIWDREHWDAKEPNSRIVAASNLILSRFATHRASAVTRWVANPTREARAQCGSKPDCIPPLFEKLSRYLWNELERIRDDAKKPGAKVPQPDYQLMGAALYFLWRQGGSNGLSSSEIEGIQDALGLRDKSPAATTRATSLDEILSSSVLTGLGADQIAQVGWLTNTGLMHAFLIGQLKTGTWFLSDQGPSPAKELTAPSLQMLTASIRSEIKTKNYWLFPGTHEEFMKQFPSIPGWTGVKRLGGIDSVLTAAQEVIPSGAFLCEIDEGVATIGERVNRSGFVGRRYILADAQALTLPSGGGGVIAEMPQGVFSVYGTTAVSDANVGESSIDADDSKGGVLATRSHYHTWLKLSTKAGKTGSWFKVY